MHHILRHRSVYHPLDPACGLRAGVLKKAVLAEWKPGILIIGYAHCLILELSYLLGVPLEK